MAIDLAEIIATSIRDHSLTTGMQVASGSTCRCGYWNGNERAGKDRPIGCGGLTWHQAQEAAAKVREALEAEASETPTPSEQGQWGVWAYVPDGVPYRSVQRPNCGLLWMNKNGRRVMRSDAPSSNWVPSGISDRAMNGEYAPFVRVGGE